MILTKWFAILAVHLVIFTTIYGYNGGRIYKGQIIGKSSIKHNFQNVYFDDKVEIDKELFPELWFTQKVDHFLLTGEDQGTWKQRYFQNNEFFKQDGPIFLLMGGEGPINSMYLKYGGWISYAEKLGAMCLILEHRFYGKSRPTKDMSVDNLRFLTSQQAIKDLEVFLRWFIKDNDFKKNKIVLFGGSYSGNLVAWAKKLYPQLIDVAVSSSAPISVVYDFTRYFEEVGKVIKSHDPNCYNVIDQAFKTLELMSENEANRVATVKPNLKDILGLCEDHDFTNEKDTAQLYLALTGFWASFVQYNGDNGYKSPSWANLTISCAYLSKQGNHISPLEKIGKLNKILNRIYGLDCTSYKYKDLITYLKWSEWPGEDYEYATMRLWTWQTCYEFAYFQTSDGKNQPFGSKFPVSMNVDECYEVYEKIFDERMIQALVERTNNFYGGSKYEGENVIFINGDKDPWHVLSVPIPGANTMNNVSDQKVVVTADLSKNIAHIVVPGGAHCIDFYHPSDEESDGLKSARREIFEYLTLFLDSGNKEFGILQVRWQHKTTDHLFRCFICYGAIVRDFMYKSTLATIGNQGKLVVTSRPMQNK